MKKLVVVFLCFFASNAFASSADSGICPWKMPFTISIHAIGELSGYSEFIPTHGPAQYTSIPTTQDSENFSITVDTSNSSNSYSLRNDTLRYTLSYIDSTPADTFYHYPATYTYYWESLTIAFGHGNDSIISMQLSGSELDTEIFVPEQPVFTDQFSVSAFSFLFNDSSIYSLDWSFKEHQFVITDNQMTSYYDYVGYGTFGTFDYQNFSATSADLSGIFKPTAFQDPIFGQYPWKFPFQLIIHTTGTGETISGPLDTLDLTATVWSGSFIAPNTFEFNSGSEVGELGSQTSYDTSLLIAFIPGEDSISSLTLSIGDNYTLTWGSEQATGQDQIIFEISSLAYNDTAIFTADSSFCTHNISATSHSTYDQNNQNTVTQNFTASSAELSGLFEPKDYTCAESVVQPLSSNGLVIQNSNGSIACSFDVSDHARDLEIFSPLGIREASFTIPAGQTEASLPHLPAGFYFVRVDGAMAKVHIAP